MGQYELSLGAIFLSRIYTSSPVFTTLLHLMYLTPFLLASISAPVKYIFGCSGQFFFYHYFFVFPGRWFSLFCALWGHVKNVHFRFSWALCKIKLLVKIHRYINVYSRKNCSTLPFAPSLPSTFLPFSPTIAEILPPAQSPFSNWKVRGFWPQRTAADCRAVDVFLLSHYRRLRRRTENYHKNRDVFCCIGITLASTTQTRAEKIKKQPFGRQPNCSGFALRL